MVSLEEALRLKGWYLKSDVIADISARVESSDVSKAHSQLLNLDLRKRGCGALPEDVLSKKAGLVHGPLIVQVSEVIDASRPSYNASKSKDGILYCSLHDGRVSGSAVALDAQTCPLSTQAAPGTKLLLQETKIEQGMLILEPERVQVLGGRVDAIAEAWEAQQKYSGVKRMTKAEINSMGPVFCHFDPTRKTQSVKGNFSMAIPTQSAEASVASTGKRPQLAKAGDGPTNKALGAGGEAPSSRPDVRRDPLATTEAASSLANAAKVKEKLRDKMSQDAAAYEGRGGGRGGRGRGRGRRGRRRDYEEEEDSGVMTMEEWEARNAGRGSAQGHSVDSDEQLARQLQAQLNAEAAEEARAQQRHNPGAGLADALFSHRQADAPAGGRRGRGGHRGRRGHGRGPR